MLNKITCMILLIVLACNVCLAQAAYKGLQAGKSTEADVEKTLGESLKRISETLIEYVPRKNTVAAPYQYEQKIYVQYREGSMVVERIEILYSQPRPQGFLVVLGIRASRPELSRVNPKGRLEEYYGPPHFILLTYETEDRMSGATRVGYYSRELFNSSVAEQGTDARAEARPAATTSAANTSADNTSANLAANTSPALSAADVAKEITVRVPDGTEIEIQLKSDVSGQEAKLGDLVDFTVIRPVQIGGVTIFERDAPARARITIAKKAGRWGKAGKLEWAMQDVLAVDGNRVPVRFTKKEVGDSKGVSWRWRLWQPQCFLARRAYSGA